MFVALPRITKDSVDSWGDISQRSSSVHGCFDVDTHSDRLGGGAILLSFPTGFGTLGGREPDAAASSRVSAGPVEGIWITRSFLGAFKKDT